MDVLAIIGFIAISIYGTVRILRRGKHIHEWVEYDREYLSKKFINSVGDKSSNNHITVLHYSCECGETKDRTIQGDFPKEQVLKLKG